MVAVRLHRDGFGNYYTDDEYEVVPALNGELRQNGWHLLRMGEWHNTFSTLDECRQAIADIRSNNRVILNRNGQSSP